MEHRLAWLHVSDFHLRAGRDPFSQDEAIRALLQDVEARIETPLSFALVTGDIAFSGHPAEYVVAHDVLTRLSETVGVPRQNFFMVPGNHDVDRGREELAFEGAAMRLRSEVEVDRLLGQIDQLEPLIRRQAGFWDFLAAFTDEQERLATPDGLGYAAPFDAGRLRLSILGLNSSWVSGRDEEAKKLLIGERHLVEALRLGKRNDPHLQIAIAHHPIDWLRDWDGASCGGRMVGSVHIYQRGHLHSRDVVSSHIRGHQLLSVAAGSAHATRHYENSYNILELDLERGLCIVRSFRYVPQRNAFEADAVDSEPVVLGSDLPGDPSEWAGAIASIEGAQRFAGYLAGLLTGYQDEIPVHIGGERVFIAIEAARSLADPADLEAMEAFLALRNQLRLYGDELPLRAQLAEHREAVIEAANWLTKQAALTERLADELERRAAVIPLTSTSRSRQGRPNAVSYLTDLRASEDWTELERAGRRYRQVGDKHLSTVASRLLAQALLRSQDGQRQAEAFELAKTLADPEEAEVEDYLIAVASAVVLKKDDDAVSYILAGLTRWPGDDDLRTVARDLATKTGDARVRRALEEEEEA